MHPWADVMLPEPLTDTGEMAPAGQLWSTAADLCRWAAFLVGGDDKVLAAGTLAEMRRPASAPEGDWTLCHGLGLEVKRQDGRLLVGHTGSIPGFVAGLWASESEDLAGVALANVTSGTSAGTIAADLVRIVAEHEPRFPAPWRPFTDADPSLLALTGPWYWGTRSLAVHLRAGGELELREPATASAPTRLRPEADGSWTCLDGYYAGEPLRVGHAADGSVTHLDLGGLILTRAPYGPAEAIPGGVDPTGWHVG